MSPFSNERGWPWCAFVAAVVCLLVLPGLGAIGFWEPFEVDLLQALVENRWRDGDPHSRLAMWSVETAVAVGGINPWTARLPFALSGIACALLCFVWVARSSSIRLATIASLLLVSAPIFLLHSRQVVSLMPAMAAQLLVLIGLTEALYSRRLHSLAALGVASLGLVLGYLTVGAILGVLVPLVAIAIVCARIGRRWACLALILIGISVAILAATGALGIGGTLHAAAPHSSWDVMLEKIVFGGFPWIALAPMALFSARATGPATSESKPHFTRQLAVSWVAISLLATSVHSMHIAPTIFLAMPALAFAAARWVCDASTGTRLPLFQTLLLCLVVVMIGMNLHSFSDRLPALHLPVDTLSLGGSSALYRNVFAGTALVFSALLLASRCSRLRALLPWTLTGVCVFFGAFVAHAWMPAISKNLSSSHLLHHYLELKRGSEPLFTLGQTPRMLALYVPEAAARQRAELANALSGESRIFALVAQRSFCSLRQLARSQGAGPIVVAENPSYVLLSNLHRPGEPRNTVLDSALYTPALALKSTLGTIEFAAALRLVRVEMPIRVRRGSDFEVRMTYEVLRRPSRKWKIFAHFDGPGIRFQGDHWPIEDRCPSNTWNPGDRVVDIARVQAGGLTHPKGIYKLWTGFFYGRSGNWTNMPVTAGKHTGDRVLVGQVEVY